MPETMTLSPTKFILIGQSWTFRLSPQFWRSNGSVVLELRTHNRRMDMLGNWSVGDREEPPSYQISRRPISRKVIPTLIAEMPLSRNFSGISKNALYSVPSFFWSLNFILFFACWSFARCGRHHLSRSSQRRRRCRRKFG